VLQCLCLGISCGFTTAWTFSLWQVEQAEVSGTVIYYHCDNKKFNIFLISSVTIIKPMHPTRKCIEEG
jgi:hypothetical protein